VPTTKTRRSIKPSMTAQEADAIVDRIEEKIASIERLINDVLARLEPRIKALEKAAEIKKDGDG
jgi:divalent metal cation (Fe/Co/Zn/Cd) transporter